LTEEDVRGSLGQVSGLIEKIRSAFAK
jgi:hypothetical protein